MSDPGTSAAFTLNVTSAITTLVVPQTGIYYIVAEGAQGGNGEGNVYGTNASPGGLGGQVEGYFALAQGETLEVAVGGQGSSPSSFETSYHVGGGGGGGATYVFLVNGNSDTILEAAGGGGGGGFSSDDSASPGGDGGIGSSGSGSGGTSVAGGGGGAGVYGDGSNAADSTSNVVAASGGRDLAEGLAGGNQGYVDRGQIFSGGGGGFGGGGGGGYEGLGGGGGGYTGGISGEGGTSYIASYADAPTLMAGVQSGNGEVTISLACFAPGTRISTPSGSVCVEMLRAGDMVLSFRRRKAVPVRRVGHRRVDCTRHLDCTKGQPVRVRTGTFGLGRPVRDLWLSPDHAVFVEDVLIPVRVLVNGTSVSHQRLPEVIYWHVEVDEHDVLLANGLPVESYLDTSQRTSFADGRMTTLTSDFVSRVWEAEGCAPLRVIGPEVDAVRARLAA